MYRPRSSPRRLCWSVLLPLVAPLLLSLGGCGHGKPVLSREYVYVTAKQTYLRDRVAAVSNRTGTVENGDRLRVLEHGRRFLRVETAKGETGWIDEKTTAPQTTYDEFEKLRDEHKADTPVASAVVRDEVYLHAAPGRESDHLFRLPEGDKLTLIRRATLPKQSPGASPHAAVRSVSASSTAAAGSGPQAPEPPPMEDWWLVRDEAGRTGWLLSRMIDVDAPDTLTRYAEGQRLVGAYVLATVFDPEVVGDNKNIPEYVTVLSPYKSGLTYDFDQVRVFIWNAKKHRYETAFRQRNIAGYLPVKVDSEADPYGKQPAAAGPAPTFHLRVLAASSPPVIPNPVTGAITPGQTIEKTYRLEGNTVRRVLPPGVTPPEEAHPNPVEEKPKRDRRRRR